ncbi:MAG TPA: DUF1127 domain-containing protein [Rhodospirillales bacterium]|jgi:uncharacterized protein YjiS (DUF1127 family)|nr:DUF1127 domain-containing protein [Rhodospirillales bacterium]
MNLLHALHNIAKRIARAHRRERARRELRALDDRQLADIGLSRGDINAVVEGLIGGPVHTRQTAGSAAAANANRSEAAA